MRLLESALYVKEIHRSVLFYERIFGFQRMVSDERFCAFNVGPGQVLLLFRKGSGVAPVTLPSGFVIPPHDGDGQLHLAFGIEFSELDQWVAKLEAAGIPIESRITWEMGGQSIYFRDPDQHLVEIATRGIWPNY
jgi:catechol 2,3-dioxygenase-like lactoylglutathione lyase family enzyme